MFYGNPLNVSTKETVWLRSVIPGHGDVLFITYRQDFNKCNYVTLLSAILTQ